MDINRREASLICYFPTRDVYLFNESTASLLTFKMFYIKQYFRICRFYLDKKIFF